MSLPDLTGSFYESCRLSQRENLMDIKDKFTGEIIISINADVLSGADLSNADLIDADLRGADLRGADLFFVHRKYERNKDPSF